MKRLIFILFIFCGLNVFAAEKTIVKSADIVQRIKSTQTYYQVTNTSLTGDLNFALINPLAEGKVSKSRTIVKKNNRSDTTLHYSSNKVARIKAHIKFSNCCFKDNVLAVKREYSKGVRVKSSTVFEQNIVFEACVFESEFNLSSSTFNGDVEFIDCVFESDFMLDASQINGKLDLSDCSFEDNASLESVLFFGNCIIDECSFSKPLSLQSSVFEFKPNLKKSKFKSIKLRNCQLQNNPLFWSFEDDKDLRKYLSEVKYDKTFYGTKINHGKKMTIRTSRSNFSNAAFSEKIMPLWDAKAQIYDAGCDDYWTVSGRIIWDKNENVLNVEKAKLISPKGEEVALGKHIIVDIDRPGDYYEMN